jgi:hypothetical protein
MMARQKDPRTLVTFLLDETGSMASIKDDTIGGFNSYLDTLKASRTPIDFTLIKFDSNRLEKVCVATPVKEVAGLTPQTYRPGASTPLIDAAYKTIKAVEKSLNGATPKVVVCIQTDGHENASTEHTWDELNALIKEKTGQGWQFNFLGTGIDAYDTGRRMGVAAEGTIASALDSRSVRASYAAVADSAMAFASGRAPNAGISMAARAASGDAYYRDVFRADGSALSTPPVRRQRSAPARPPAKRKIVDDFAL